MPFNFNRCMNEVVVTLKDGSSFCQSRGCRRPFSTTNMNPPFLTRRRFFSMTAAGSVGTLGAISTGEEHKRNKAHIAITFDLEMSRHYPKRGMLEWDYQKGNLDEATKKYSVEAANVARERGAKIHFFCVGRVLEQANIDWIKQIAAGGHPIGNHTYDHVNVLAKTSEEVQFRFQRSPWLIKGRSIEDVLRENIRLTSIALKQRAGIEVNGFRTPGGFPERSDRPGRHSADVAHPRFQHGRAANTPHLTAASRGKRRRTKSSRTSSEPRRKRSRFATRADWSRSP